MRAVARAAAAAVAIALAAAVARAGDGFEPGSIRAEIETAVRDGRSAEAAALLDRLIETREPFRAQFVEAAKAALEFLPRDVAHPRAVELLAKALKLDPSNADGAWRAAQDLRKALIRRGDAATGIPFLVRLRDVYPKETAYRWDLARLLLLAGRRSEARESLSELVGGTDAGPGVRDLRAAMLLAVVLEQDGDVAGALALYDRVLATPASDAAAHADHRTAHDVKIRILSRPDPAGAARALDAARRHAETLASEAERNDFVESLDRLDARLAELGARRDAIRALTARSEATTATALAGWCIAVVLLLRATRAADGGVVPRTAAGPAAGN